MKVRLIELDTAWADVPKNIATVQALIDNAAAADLYVLPEMWATGFATQPQGIAESEERSAALAWMKQTACARQCAISGSLAVQVADGSYRNRHYFVTPETVWHYDKRHLFAYGHEDKFYTRGDVPVVAVWQGFRILLQTCYDLRFPVFSRYGGCAGEYDAIIYTANWPASRMPAWTVLTTARAIENLSYVLAVNRTGSDPKTNYAGGSRIIDPIGRTMAETPASFGAELSIEKLRQMRQRFQVLADRD